MTPPRLTFDRAAFVANCDEYGIEFLDSFEPDIWTSVHQLDLMLSQGAYEFDGRAVSVGAVSTGDNGLLVVGALTPTFLDAEQGDIFDDGHATVAEMADYIQNELLPRLEADLVKCLEDPLAGPASHTPNLDANGWPAPQDL